MLIRIILLFGLTFAAFAALRAQTDTLPRVVVGAERLDLYLPMLAGKQVGLVVNPTARVGATHLLDTLLARGVCVTRIFAPEHGFRGEEEAGEEVRNGLDVRTGTPVISLYGRKKKPSTTDLAFVDVVIFDIQDVGARFYTYISTLFYVLEACAANDKPILVLDRPNPNGHLVDGPLLEPDLESFVGIAPLPLAHGCTVGELARYFTGEDWIWKGPRPSLTVVPCLHYTHHTPYDLPVKPSPNLPDSRSVLLYPSICLFEGTVASVGRGTDTPFQLIGHPDFPVQDFCFIPRCNTGAKSPLFDNQRCYGYDMRGISIDSLRARSELDLHWLLDFYCEYPDKSRFFLKNNFFDMLAGTPELRRQIELGTSEAEIRASWQPGLDFFKSVRKPYLLYPV